MTIQILDEALDDLAAGYRFYEQQTPGLGDDFLDSLWSDIQSLRLYGGIHALHHGHYRLLAKRFPFAVYYLIESEQTISVRAILDCRRNPCWTQERLG
ncbi:MAG: type II toxin-antitoxin system RelE/ParE family toxin [Desulfuromonas sp.]|jgi:hypothetical protein|nr:type II toxin-antitoxin system RelE/ParE family toxin [Desulfuromonas thiophila]